MTMFAKLVDFLKFGLFSWIYPAFDVECWFHIRLWRMPLSLFLANRKSKSKYLLKYFIGYFWQRFACWDLGKVQQGRMCPGCGVERLLLTPGDTGLKPAIISFYIGHLVLCQLLHRQKLRKRDRERPIFKITNKVVRAVVVAELTQRSLLTPENSGSNPANNARILFCFPQTETVECTQLGVCQFRKSNERQDFKALFLPIIDYNERSLCRLKNSLLKMERKIK